MNNTLALTASPVALIAFFLALARAVAWVATAPPFTSLTTSPMIRVSLAVGLALLAYPSVPVSHVPMDTATFIGAILIQVIMGVALGMATKLFFSAVEAAGAVTDLFAGINLPPALDPLSENQVPLIGSFFNLVATALLFASGLYLVLVKGFVSSFGALGMKMTSFQDIALIFSQDIERFLVATLEIAAPILVVLICAQVILGLVAKAAPQSNVFLLGFPFQIALALISVALGLRVLPPYVFNIVGNTISDGVKFMGLQ